MSLILDALKRAERERQSIGSPATGDAAPAAPRRRRAPVLILGALVLIAGSAVAWFVLHKKPAGAPIEVVQRTAPAKPTAPSRPPQPQPTQPRVAPPPPVVRGTEGAASLDDLTGPGPEAGEAPLPPVETPPARNPSKPAHIPGPPPATEAKPAPAPAPAPQAKTEVPAAEPPVEETPAPQDTTPPPRQETAPAERPRPLPPALTQQVPMRKLREMPPDYRAAFPALSVDVHNYEKDATRRFVMINGRRYHEGERIAEGPQIAEIVRDGIVFDFRGEKVLYPLSR